MRRVSLGFPDRSFLLALVAQLICVLLLVGCANLQAIRQFAQSSTHAETYKTIVADFAEIPEREKYYSPTERHDAYDAKKKRRDSEQEALLNIQRVIAEYMKALEELADDELVSFDKSVDSLAEGLKGLNELNDSEIQAFSSITKLLTRAMTDGYRRRQLKLIITKSNDHLQVLISRQKELVLTYVSDLSAEKTSIDSYYGKAIMKSLHHKTINSKKEKFELERRLEIPDTNYNDIILQEIKDPYKQSLLIILRDNMQERMDTISKKQVNAMTYVDVLNAIGEGHQKLFDGRDELRSAELLANIRGYSKYITAMINNIRSLR